MDMVVQWGVFRRLRNEIGASGAVLLSAIGLDSIALGAFLVAKFGADPLILWVAPGGITLVFGSEGLFLQHCRQTSPHDP